MRSRNTELNLVASTKIMCCAKSLIYTIETEPNVKYDVMLDFDAYPRSFT